MAFHVSVEYSVPFEKLLEDFDTVAITATGGFVFAIQEEVNISPRTESVCGCMKNMSESAQRPTSGDGKRIDNAP